MSYDLHLLPLSTNGYPETEAFSYLEKEEKKVIAGDLNPGPPIPEKEAKKKKLAELLIESNAELEAFEFDFVKIAESHEWTEEEARIRYRHIELNGLDDGNGIQITLHDDTADLTFPYWHQSEAAKAVIDEVWGYLKILVEHGGLSVFDPQLGRILDLSKDRDEVIQVYGGVMDKMPTIIEDAQRRSKPWWRFWR